MKRKKFLEWCQKTNRKEQHNVDSFSSEEGTRPWFNTWYSFVFEYYFGRITGSEYDEQVERLGNSERQAAYSIRQHLGFEYPPFNSVGYYDRDRASVLTDCEPIASDTQSERQVWYEAVAAGVVPFGSSS